MPASSDRIIKTSSLTALPNLDQISDAGLHGEITDSDPTRALVDLLVSSVALGIRNGAQISDFETLFDTGDGPFDASAVQALQMGRNPVS